MSTYCTICTGLEWTLFEEMLEEKVYFRIERPNFFATQSGVTIELPPRLIDEIRKAPDSAFPHLRKPGKDGMR